MTLETYLNLLCEDKQPSCEDKHAKLKKDPTAFNVMVAICKINRYSEKHVVYSKQEREMKQYCTSNAIEKRKGRRALINPMVIRNCKKAQQKKWDELKSKISSNIKKWAKAKKDHKIASDKRKKYLKQRG